jgi:hypothetical protein
MLPHQRFFVCTIYPGHIRGTSVHVCSVQAHPLVRRPRMRLRRPSSKRLRRPSSTCIRSPHPPRAQPVASMGRPEYCCLRSHNQILAWTIHLLNDSQILLSTESQSDPSLNHALLQWWGSLSMIALAPFGVCCAKIAHDLLNNIEHGAFAHAQNNFCQSLFLNFFLQLAYMCLAQFLCSALGIQFCTALRIPYERKMQQGLIIT